MKSCNYLNNKIDLIKLSIKFAILSFLMLFYSNGVFAQTQTVSVNSPANCFASTFVFSYDAANSPDATGRNVYFYSNSSLEIRYNNASSRWEIRARGGNFDIYYVNSYASSPNPPDSGTSAWDDFGFCDTTGAPTVSGDGTQTTIGGDPCASLGGDTDGDGACDNNDICLSFDDFADQDFDGIPDGCDANPTVPDGVLIDAACLNPDPILFTLSGTDGTGRNIYSTTFANGLEVRYSAANQRWEVRASGGNMDVYLYNTFDSWPNPPSSAGTWQGTSVLNCNTAPTPTVNGSGTQTTLGCTISLGTPSITQPTCGGDGAISIAATGAKGAVTYTLKQGGVELASTAGPGTFTLLNAGTYTIVASDGAFPSGVCEAETSDIILVLQDNTPPAITCPGDIIVSNDPGDCGAVVNYKVPVGTDNCSGAITNLTAGLGSGSFFPVGETTETYTVTDATGKQVACSFKVTVVDNEPPVLNCQDFTIELGADGTFQFNYSVLLAATGATDNCGLVSFNNSVSNAFDCSFLGTRPITIFAVDSNGQISSCTVNLTVTDPLSACCQAPIITCPADVTLQCGDSTDPVATGTATAIEGCGLVTINYSDAPSIIICGNSLKFLRTWTATDEKGNMDSCTQLIKVMDATPPVLTVPGDVTLECSDDDPQQTDRLTVNSPAGISGSYSTGIAYFGPVLTSIPITADIQLVNDGSGITSDACEGPLQDLTGKIALIDRRICSFASKVKKAQDAGALGVIIINNIGTTDILFMSGDGITNNINIPSVSVSKNTGDALKAALLLGTVNATLADPEIIVNDNCDSSPVVTFSRYGTLGSCPNSFTFINTWTATDACGNAISASQTITVEDNTPPTLNVVAENTVECSEPTIPYANRLAVNSTIGAGDYLTGIGFFAAQLNSVPLIADLQLASGNGCEPLADLTGKIALIDRGICSFSIKVQSAKDAGALAVIIANNDTVNPDTVINVVGPYEVQLPMVFVSYNSGLALKNAMLSETVNVSLFDNDITVNDNCDVMPIVMISDLQSIPGTCDNEGDLIYTYTATDACGNASSVIRTIHIIDTTPPVIVCPDQEPYTRSTDSGLCTYKVVADEFDPIASDNCTVDPALSWVVSNPNAITQNGIDTLADVELQSGINTITWTADDGCGNTSSCSFIVNVDKITTITTVTATPSTQQYSDKVTFDVTVTPGDCSGAGQAASFALIYVGNQLMGKAILTVDGFENLVGTLDAALLENPAYPSNGQMSPGLKTVKAVFMGVNPNYTVNDATTDLTITREDAIAEYTGLMLQATAPRETTATVDLSFNIQDITCTDASDPDPGDIRNAIVDVYVEGSLVQTFTTIVLVDPSDTKTGTVTVPYTFNIGVSSSESYTVRAEIRGYYTGSTETVITVYEPVGDFITGGGYIVPDNSAGEYASTDGLKTNFGFNVGYNKKGNKLKGHMNIIFRRMESDGLHKYQIKGNAIQSLGVDISDENAKFAQFITKANLTDITDPLNIISLGGNFILKVDMTDRGEPGTDDSIAINLTNGGTLVYSSNWTGISTQEMILSAGNLLVHSGYSVGAAKSNTTTSTEVDRASGTFNLMAWPNPSKDEFYLKLNSANRVEKVEIFVYDINGRQVHFNSGKVDQEFRFGKTLESGVYFLNLVQGDKSSQLKLIKY